MADFLEILSPDVNHDPIVTKASHTPMYKSVRVSVMQMDSAVKRSVWWKGAVVSALKGIPQGILLGALGAAALVAGIWLIGAISVPTGAYLANTFGAFVYSGLAPGTVLTVAPTLASLAPWPLMAMNSALTAVGNFVTGGDIAVAKYQQEIDHRHNDQRIAILESREKALEQAVVPRGPHPAKIQAILDRGAHADFHEAEEHREQQVAAGPTIH